MLTRVIKRDQSIERRPLRLFLSIIAGVSLMTTVFVQDTVASDPKEKVRLAIFPLFAMDFTSEQVAFVRNHVKTVVEKTGGFDTMSDAVMQAIVMDLGLPTLEDCQLPSCLALIGSRLGVQQVLHSALEQVDSTTILHFKLVSVADAKVLFARRIVHTGQITRLTTGELEPLWQDLTATLKSETNIRWYYVAGAVLAVGATIYLLSKAFIDKDRHYEDAPPNPPPPPGN